MRKKAEIERIVKRIDSEMDEYNKEDKGKMVEVKFWLEWVLGKVF